MRALVVGIVVAVVAACGLGPAPDPAEYTGTGTAPWRDRGPVTVCDGSRALAPPSTEPGGLCAAASESPTSCTLDRDCRDREACVCGRCTVAFCAVSSDCDAPRVCNFSQQRCDLACTSDADCGDAENCISSVCRGRCATDADCQRGEHCDSGHVCSSTECSDGSACRTGDVCEVQRTPRQALEPAPLARDGRVVLYLDLADTATPDAHAIWRAETRSDLVSHFILEPDAPIISDARAPSAVVEPDGTVDLFIETASGIAVLSSSDGVAFGAPTVVLPGDLHAPTAVHTGDQLVVYYASLGAIGMATGASATSLEDRGIVLAPSDVVVGDGSPGTAFWIGITTLASPHAILAGPVGAQTIRLWFAGFGQESSPATRFGTTSAIPANFSIGFAAADPTLPGELHPWPYGPVADRVEGFVDHREELGPAVVERDGDGGDRFLLYYVAATPAPGSAGADGPFVIGRLGYLGSGTP